MTYFVFGVGITTYSVLCPDEGSITCAIVLMISSVDEAEKAL